MSSIDSTGEIGSGHWDGTDECMPTIHELVVYQNLHQYNSSHLYISIKYADSVLIPDKLV